jgi:hypothetical protein
MIRSSLDFNERGCKDGTGRACLAVLNDVVFFLYLYFTMYGTPLRARLLSRSLLGALLC